MSRFKKIALYVIFLEILAVIVVNIILVRYKKTNERFYVVESKRIVQSLESGISPSDIDLSEYKHIVGISEFVPEEICNNDYLVEKVGDTLYRIEYNGLQKDNTYLIVNCAMTVFILINICVFAYVGFKLVKPFNDMSDMTYELAKGNLVKPLKADKNRFLGKFLWGVDMLRENLEDSKAKNLEYQKEKKTLMVSLSHDIKTPLSAICLYAKALEEGLYDDENAKKEALEKILGNTEEIKAYVDEIYKLSREEFMDFSVTVEEIYLKKVVDKLCAYYMDKLSILHTEFDVSDFEDVLVSGDGDRLLEAMQNLMENAIKYGDGKRISIEFAREEDCVLMTVSNTGCTLPVAEVSNLFDSFYRGSNTENIGGNGLGLYIVKQLMRRMDGDAYVTVEDGNFYATLVVRMI